MITPPAGEKVDANELLETFGANANLPSTREIRSKAWL